jgi:hypothetical protein
MDGTRELVVCRCKCKDSLKQLQRRLVDPQNGNKQTPIFFKKHRKIAKHTKHDATGLDHSYQLLFKQMPAEAFIFARPQRIWTRFIVFDLPGQY